MSYCSFFILLNDKILLIIFESLTTCCSISEGVGVSCSGFRVSRFAFRVLRSAFCIVPILVEQVNESYFVPLVSWLIS
jgi:hypothetical protein